MKKNLLKIIALAAALVLCAVSLSGCIVIRLGDSSGSSDNKAETYENASKYNVAPDDGASVSGNIKKLYIFWTAGSVTFGKASGNNIGLSEESSTTLDERTRMHYYFDGEALYVRYTASGRFAIGTLAKKLTVNLPEGAHFDEISVSTVSASVKAASIVADDVTFNTVSGKIEAPDITADDELSIRTVSGDVECGAKGKADDVEIDTVSGRVSLTLAMKVKLRVNTTSGNVKVYARVSLSKAEFNSVSGALELGLPSGTGFDAKLRSVSGSVSTDFSTKVENSHYIAGDGSVKIEAASISGNIKISAMSVNN